MKKLLILFIVSMATLNSMAQVDSNKLYVKNITFQARDIEMMTQVMLGGAEIYEDFYDLAKAKFRVANPPANTQNVTIDSLRIDVLIHLSGWMRSADYGTVAMFFTRVDAVIKALPNSYLQSKVSEMDSYYINRIVEVRTEGRRRLRGIRL